jgi:integrase
MQGCRVITPEEVQAILSDLHPRDRLIVLTGLHFGTRISETLALTFGDVSGKYLSIKSAKGSDNATFPISDTYASEVETVRQNYINAGKQVAANTPLFLSRKGHNKAISRQQASDVITAACERLGIDGKVNTHSARKTFVTKIYALTGKDIAETKKYSRHKSLANLDYYIGTTNDLSLVNALDWT